MGSRKKRVKEDNPSADWELTYELQINGRKVEPGTELKIKGERGRFRFIKHVVTPTAEWIDVWGGPRHAQQWRSFRVDKVVRVHYKNTTEQAMVEEYKAKKRLIKDEQSK